MESRVIQNLKDYRVCRRGQIWPQKRCFGSFFEQKPVTSETAPAMVAEREKERAAQRSRRLGSFLPSLVVYKRSLVSLRKEPSALFACPRRTNSIYPGRTKKFVREKGSMTPRTRLVSFVNWWTVWSLVFHSRWTLMARCKIIKPVPSVQSSRSPFFFQASISDYVHRRSSIDGTIGMILCEENE